MASRALHHDMQSWTWCGDSLQFIFHAAGVAQGCPLSGSLWALTFDPFLHHLCTGNMEGYGSVMAADGFDVGNIDYPMATGPVEMAPLIAGACADDVGV
eukprot:5898707-Pyramimonas_sp.AAC.1